MGRVLCFGSMNIDYTYRVDHFATRGETIASNGLNLFTGGKGLNQAVAMSRAGVSVCQAGSVGRDGEFLLDFLEGSGVDCSLVQRRRDVRTGNAIIQNDASGDNCIILYGGTNRCIDREYVDTVLSHFSAGDYIVLQNEISEVPYIISEAHRRGMKVILNPAPCDDSMTLVDRGCVDLLILNTVEAMQLCGFDDVQTGPEQARELICAVAALFGRSQVVLTLGSGGSMYYDGLEIIRQPAYDVAAVDTTGAGDTFTGYFVAGIIEGLSVKKALEQASLAAAIAVTKQGAAPSIPEHREVMAMKTRLRPLQSVTGSARNTATKAATAATTAASAATTAATTATADTAATAATAVTTATATTASTVPARRKVILDCDTGSDDAVAIMLAILSERIDLLGICTVAGNKNIDFTTENTLAVVEALHSKVPVYRGCSESLVAGLLPGRHGGYDGMSGVTEENRNEKGEVISYHSDHLPLPEPTGHEEREHAVFWLIDTIMRSAGDITVVTTGPMTNLAMAIRLCPDICSRIQEVIFMGGGFKVANATSAAEFNIWTDPEAAQICITSGMKITMVPLDATHRANFSLTDCDELEAIGSVPARAVAEMTRMRIEAYDLYQPQAIEHTAPIHDALALSYVIDPEVLRDIRLMRVDVDISGGFADGQTICDTRPIPAQQPNVYVALDADRVRFVALTKELLARTREK